MITIHLEDGGQIEVPGGVKGEFVRVTKNVYHDELVETVVNVYDDSGYSAKVLASFKASEVVGFTVTDEKED